LIAKPTAKEQRFCKKQGIEIINADVSSLLQAAGMEFMTKANEEARQEGC